MRPKLVQITLRFPEDQYEKISEIATSEGCDIAHVFRRCVQLGLAPYDAKHERLLDEFHNLASRMDDLEDLLYLSTSTACALGASLISKKEDEDEESVRSKRREYVDQLMNTAVKLSADLKRNPNIGTPARKP